MNKKYKRKKSNKKKKNQQIWITAIAAIMLLSALSFMSYSNDQGTRPQEDDQNLPVKSYLVQPVSNTSGTVMISGVKNELVIIPENPSAVGRRQIEQISSLESKIITNVVVESTNIYTFFRFEITDMEKARDEINSLRIQGGFETFNVYDATVSQVNAEIIGKNLTVGKQADALLFRHTTPPYNIIGFSQSGV